MEIDGEQIQEREQKDVAYFRGFGGKRWKKYPAWRYHKWKEPLIVHGTDEDYQASIAGWKKAEVPVTSVKYLVNWRADLEDMSPRQLVLFAKEEYGIDFNVEAGSEKLLKAIWRLIHYAPQSKGRICLLAQTIEMNYDETVRTIQEMGRNMEMTESRVFYA